MKMAERLVPFPPISLVGMDDLQRFWAKIDRIGKSGEDYWLWVAGCFRNPITGERDCGCFKLKSHDYVAYRVSYFFHHRKDPGQLLVCHTCNVRLCVNPSHLVLGDHSANLQYSFDCGRRSHKGELNPLSAFSNSQAVMIRESDESATSLAKRFGVHVSRIYAIRNGETYRNI